MFDRFYQFWAVFIILTGLFSCASPKAPTGGDEDVSPPTIIEAESTPNKQTNFHEKEIVLEFDEWVTLKDVYSQLVISPLMPDEPEIKQRGKAIIIELPDSLKEETTYTINFGSAITDLHEGNILENYVFVFSTGSVLDSIKLSGTVVDAITLKPAPDVWAMLYPVGEDSAVYLRKPEYLAKTNKEGKWSLSYLRADSFQVVALKDENINFIYDQDAEYFGWIDTAIYTGNISEALSPILVFPKEKRTGISDVIHAAPGWLKIIVNAPHPKPVPAFLPAIDTVATFWNKDTLNVLYDPAKNYAGEVVLNNDTTRIRIATASSLQNQIISIRPVTGRIAPGGVATYATPIPIMKWDTSLIILHHDTLGEIPYVIERNKSRNELNLKANWAAASRYYLTFLPGAVTDIWGRTNDTIKSSIVVTPADQYGDMTISLAGLDSTRQYMVHVKEGEQILNTFVVEGQSQTKLANKNLPPAKYVIEIIEDLNRNKTWDTGDYSKRRQPEPKMLFIPEPLRAGWEVEVKITWK